VSFTNPAPDKKGLANAWRMDVTPEVSADHLREWGHTHGSIGPTWIVNGPYHLLWSWWIVGCISLRPIPGVPDANKDYPEAEYEIGCWSLNPDPDPPRPKIPNITALRGGRLAERPEYLTPQDWRVHFHGVTDEQAAKICEYTVDAIVAGHSCDSDYRTWWRGAITKTVEHFVLGVHA
jgi:hypothetical protein